MAREVLIRVWCDRHLAMDPPQRAEATATRVSIGSGREARTGDLELCPECHDVVLGAALSLLAPGGRRGIDSWKEPTDKTAPRECLVCGNMYGGSRHAKHLKDVHGLTLQDVYGLTCPLCESAQETITGLAVHGNKAHHTKGIVDMFARARDEGDGFGLYAKAAANVGRATDSESASS